MPTQAAAKPSMTRPLSMNIRLRSALIMRRGMAAATTYWLTKSLTGEENGVRCRFDSAAPSTRMHNTPGIALPNRDASAMKPTHASDSRIAVRVSASPGRT